MDARGILEFLESVEAATGVKDAALEVRINRGSTGYRTMEVHLRARSRDGGTWIHNTQAVPVDGPLASRIFKQDYLEIATDRILRQLERFLAKAGCPREQEAKEP